MVVVRSSHARPSDHFTRVGAKHVKILLRAASEGAGDCLAARDGPADVRAEEDDLVQQPLEKINRGAGRGWLGAGLGPRCGQHVILVELVLCLVEELPQGKAGWLEWRREKGRFHLLEEIRRLKHGGRP